MCLDLVDNIILPRIIQCAARKGFTHSSAELQSLELELAAHQYLVSDPQYSSDGAGKSNASYARQTGLRLDQTTYGQNATALDLSGCLNSMNTMARAGAAWLGKPPSQQIPYDQRD